MARTPKVGDRFNVDDFDTVMAAAVQRKENFPEESSAQGLALIMFNIGDRYSEIECENGEWTGVKQEVVFNDEGNPSCPNGHPVNVTRSLALGWVEVD